MTGRFWSLTLRTSFAAAAVWVLASTTLVPSASAAPVREQAGGLCTTKEWADPRNWDGPDGCVARLKNAGVAAATCVQAPTPDAPDAGLPGWVTVRTDASTRPGVRDRYTDYGVGGYGLSVYDQGCVSGVTHPEASALNTLASGEFTVAATITGAGNTLREEAYTPTGTWGFLDGMISGVVSNAYRYVFTPFGMITLVLVGLWLIWRSSAGRLSEMARTVGWALFVTAAMTALFRYPVWVAHVADEAGTQGLAVSHSVVGLGPQDTPAKDCIMYSADPDGCRDHRTAAGRASAVVTDALLYDNWLRAELGSSDSATAKTYGPELYDAQTLSWDEAADITAHPEMRAQILQEKADRWNITAAKIKADDPAAYEHLQGKHGMDRAGAGFVAVLSAVFFSAFDIAASLIIMFGFLAVRLVIMCLPTIATVGIFRPASGPLRRLVNFAVGALWQVILLGFLSGVYLSATALILTWTGIPGPVRIALIAITGVFCWLARRPAKRLRNLGRIGAPAETGTRTTAPAEAVAA